MMARAVSLTDRASSFDAAPLPCSADRDRRSRGSLLATVPLRFPTIRFNFSHCGGTLPFLAARLAPFVAMKLALGDVAPGASTRHEGV
jgi:hypothetical protein